ncbi:MAG TPA: SCO family protein [Trebonia sp.]|nr:SCO family protein [Trebonia sp.]
MNSGLSPDDPILVAAFRAALVHQAVIAILLLVLLWTLWAVSRNWLTIVAFRSAPADRGNPGEPDAGQPARTAEPPGRMVLRIGFGLLWLFDGILQAQPKMAGGLPSQVIEPTAQSSPAWVQHLVNWGGTIWSYHPVQAASASVWIQVGVGVWLLTAPRGGWSRSAGLASVAWGLIVWIWGESFGGIFAPGLSWLTGAPGAVLLYCVAGALIALPDRWWRSPAAGRRLLAGTGLFWVGMAVLQAWPGRGFWRGGGDGTLPGMVQSMAQVSQPHPLSALVAGFGSFDAAHAFAVNLFTVVALASLGTVFLTGRPRLVRAGVIAGTVLCLADWVLVQDLGFLGGLGTDPNSMIPMIVLLWAGYRALSPVSAVPEPLDLASGTRAVSWRAWTRPAWLRDRLAATGAGTIAAVSAAVVVAIGAAPMAAASADANADPVIAQAIAGDTMPLDQPAPAFRFTDQNGSAISLASLRGKVVLLTFLDPVCTTDCPLIAQEFKDAGRLLGAQARQVELVAIVANPSYLGIQFTRAFDQQEGLSTVPDWLYLTGTLAQLKQTWDNYGVTVENLPAGAMSAHDDLAVVIDRTGHIRFELSADPGPGTASSMSSFGVLLAGYARQALAGS